MTLRGIGGGGGRGEGRGGGEGGGRGEERGGGGGEGRGEGQVGRGGGGMKGLSVISTTSNLAYGTVPLKERGKRRGEDGCGGKKGGEGGGRVVGSGGGGRSGRVPDNYHHYNVTNLPVKNRPPGKLLKDREIEKRSASCVNVNVDGARERGINGFEHLS